MKMMDCPRWHSCSAPICPFWGGGIHRKGEPICYYLRELYKENAKANFEKAGVGNIYKELETLAPKVIAGSRLIRKELERSSKTNSRLARTGRKKTEVIEKNSGAIEVYGTAVVQGIGEGIAEDRYTPIHPLPAAQNGIHGPKLSGDRNRCPSCLAYFNSITAFDKHRTGKFDGSRRCLSTDEMLAQGFGKTSDGFWLAPVKPEDRKRLTCLRARSTNNGERMFELEPGGANLTPAIEAINPNLPSTCCDLFDKGYQCKQ
jgi:hypothetical protein